MKWLYRRQVAFRYIRRKGKLRKISTYKKDGSLKSYHKKIVELVEQNSIPSEFATAYIKERSIITNAQAHMDNDYFILLDIHNFFNSISHEKLAECMFRELNHYQQINTIEECKKIVANVSISECGIPLGFITSPILANLYLKEFDQMLYDNLQEFHLQNVKYTRYADDIVISFKTSEGLVEGIADTIMELVKRLLDSYSLKLNEHKTRVIDLKKSNHVKITGLNICILDSGERKLTIGRKEKNDLFWRAVKCYKENTGDRNEILYLKGMQSYILSVEDINYERCFSRNMVNMIYELGFGSLKELIDRL